MIIKNGKVLLSDFVFKKTDISICGDIINDIGALDANDESFDAEGLYVLPGFIDTHIHGVNNVEFASPNSDFTPALRYEAEHGITSIAPTTRTLPVEHICRAFDNIRRESLRKAGARIIGIHAEGPFVSPSRKGAMNPEYMKKPEISDIDLLISHGGGLFKLLSMAPEIDSGFSVIRYAAEHGITVSLAHTDADFELARGAVDAGASQATHIFNAMRPFNHRDVGVLGECLTDDRVKCEMICDFIHLSSVCVSMVYRQKGAGLINLVSDTGMVSGLPDGEYTVDGRTRILKDGVLRLKDGTIAGSGKTVYDGVKNLFSLGIPLEEISRMASYNPAKTMGAEHITGTIAPGFRADIVCLDSQLEIKAVFADGIRYK